MQKITVFQQKGSAASKIAGMKRLAGKSFGMEVINIDEDLPPLIDDASSLLPSRIDADLVLDYLTHPDLSEDLSRICEKSGIPVVASGKKMTRSHAMTPSLCCMLARHQGLGTYGEIFGTPEIDVTVQEGTIKKVCIRRGAPCGATWDAGAKIEGLSIDEARVRYGLEVQFFCTANPASWDPINGKSPVHMAADIHTSALKKALDDFTALREPGWS
ncbi:MAG: hypothetical protein HQK66_03535 [Desulfamplus sp.]|nr:hypothetical protein [Desulfamplus sp.]